MVGIYKITNPKGKAYIGQSLKIEKRFKTYYGLYCKGQNKLYFSLKKYGVDNHKFEIIEECKEEILNEREIYYIKEYNSIEEGLNIKEGGIGGKFGKELRDKISSSKLKNPYYPTKEHINKIKMGRKKTVYQFSLDGKLIKKWNSIREASQTTQISEASISGCATNLKNQRTSHGYVWGFNSKFPLKSSKNQYRKIIQYSVKGEKINEFTNIQDVVKFVGINKNNIQKCLRKQSKTAGQFVWLYEGEKFPQDNYLRNSRYKKIHQFSKDGIFINTYPSISVAAKSNGIKRGLLYQALHKSGGKYKDYIFSYTTSVFDEEV